MVWRAAPDGPDLVQETVLAKEVLQAQGLVNIFTNEGLPVLSSPQQVTAPNAITRTVSWRPTTIAAP